MSDQLELFEDEVQAVVVESGETEEERTERIDRETIELCRIAREDIKRVYLDESIPGDFSVSFSGGKDSGLTLKLVFEVLESLPPEQRTRMIHVTCSDTMIETPQVHEHMMNQVKQIGECIEKNKMPATVRVVKRDMKDSYFVGIIGLGYKLPDNKNRYCTDKLKLVPQNKAMKEIAPSLIITGVRNSESERRSKAYTEKFQETNEGVPLFMPILDFTVEHVWSTYKYSMPWGSSLPYRIIYREATGECGLVNAKATEIQKVEGCSARFGCWVCAVVKADKSTEAMAAHHPWLRPLLEWRKLHIIIAGHYTPDTADQKKFYRSKELRMWEEITKVVRYLSRSGYNRKGKPMMDGSKHRHDWGTSTIEARKFLLETLLETQDEVNRMRYEDSLSDYEVIPEEEVNYIRNLIAEDERDRPWLSSGIKNFGEVFRSKIAEIERKHKLHWEERPLRCPECAKRMKIVRPGVQKCKCGQKVTQIKMSI